MAVSYIGQSTGTNTISSMPSHQAGDMLLFFAFRDGNTAPPTVPSGKTTLNAATGANTCSASVGFMIATGASETSGTWTNATSLIVHVYRPASGKVLAPGAVAVNGASSTTLNYPALTLWNLFSNSWVVGFCGHRSVNVAVETPPSGMTNRSTDVDATDEVGGHDTNGVVSSWSSTNVTGGGTASGYRSAVVEIFEIDDTVALAFSPTDTSSDITLSGSDLIATSVSTAVTKAVRANTCRLTGRHVFAVTYTTAATGNDMAFGLATKAQSLSARLHLGTSVFSIEQSGAVSHNNALVTTVEGYAQGDTLFWAVDFDTGDVWIRVNSGDWNNNASADPDADSLGFSIPSGLEGQPLFPIAGFWNSDGVWTLDPAATGHGLTTFDTWEAVSGTQTLTPSLFTNSQSFYAPTVTPASVTLTPSLFTNTNTFYSPTVSQGGSTQTLTPDLFTNTSTFYGPTVVPGVATLSPGLFTNTSTFYAATVTPGSVTLTPGLLTNTSVFYGPTAAPGTATLSPGLLTNSNTFYSPTVIPGAVTLAAGLLTNTQTFYPPTVSVPGGLQTLTPSLLTNLSVFYAAAVNQNDPPGTYPLAIEGDPSTVKGRLLGGGSVVAGSIPSTGRVVAGYLRGRP